ncbi:Crp/Fnr family transcriptional regulator [Sphingomonas sp. KR3-1]|uniref:Crp/Fnr family transcriptional regulator n=1 Tax=Sphingomonas sp. KR3-1 TaxID=3156611 RepID=UPI0032B5F0EF
MPESDRTSAAPDSRHMAVVVAAFRCDAGTASDIAARLAIVRRSPRQVVLAVGETGSDAWLILIGEAHAVLYSAAGHLVLLHRLLPGDLFGEPIGLPAAAEGVQVVAVGPVEAGRFRAIDFLMLMERHHCVAQAVVRTLSGRLDETTRRMIAGATLSAAGRVHGELLRLARLADGRCIRPAPVLSELALAVQSTRETVSRAINALERSGIITRSAEALEIVAPHRLEELVY